MILDKTKMETILGGRKVVKYDTNGDGRWNIKVVFRNNGTVVVRGRNT